MPLIAIPPEGYEEPTLVGTEKSPFEHFKCPRNDFDEPAEKRKIHQWVKARGKISEEGGHQAHLSALAYMSDSYFIGTVSRIHRLWRFPFQPEEMEHLEPEIREHINKLNDVEGSGSLESMRDRPKVGMMVSLDQ